MDALYTDGDPRLALGDFLEDYLTPGGAHYDEVDNFTGAGPGARAVYSNIGAGLVGYLVEASTGQDFADYCDAHLFAPLGLEEEGIGWYLADVEREAVAVPYEWWLGDYRPVAHYGFPDYPSGQLRAGAEPVARFLLAIMGGGGSVVEAATVEEMMTIQFPDLDADQGLGWYRWRLDGETVWGHNGGELGAATEILFWSEEGRGVVVLMNGEGDAGSIPAIERAIRDAAADL